MKIVFALLATLNYLALAFQVVPASRPATSLQMGLLDGMFSKPVKKEGIRKYPAAQPAAATKTTRYKKTGTSLWLDTFFSHPVHGHGTDEHSLEDMYDAQQEVLEERRHLFGNGHNVMKNKYSKPDVDHLQDIRTHEHDPAMLNQKEDDAMYM